VLLLSLDTVRADSLSHYGYERFTSPILDQMAAEGVVFEDASSTAPWTLPAHASMLTGLNPIRHGAVTTETALPETHPTLTSILGGAGWRTGTVVSTLWLQRDLYGLTRDFELYRELDVPAHRRSPSTSVTDQAIEWMEQAGNEPLFLFLHYFDVHGDYASLPQYERLFVTPYEGPADGTGWQLMRANLSDRHLAICREDFDPRKCHFGPGNAGFALDETMSKFHFDEDDIRHNKELYDAGIRQLDTELGRLFGFLRETDRLASTLLIVTSDHGEEFMEHGQVAHYVTQYQEVLRVPLLVVGPGVPSNVRIDAPVSLVDLVPTVLSRVGLPVPEGIDGLDLSPLWRGENVSDFDERFLYGEASGGLTHRLIVENVIPIRWSVRRGRWKLQYESIGPTYQLYDLANDPLEQVDVAGEQPEILAELRAELEDRYADFTPGALRGPTVELDPDEVERLRALGYAP
jgi:arylsulfatase A-like enzyme